MTDITEVTQPLSASSKRENTYRGIILALVILVLALLGAIFYLIFMGNPFAHKSITQANPDQNLSATIPPTGYRIQDAPFSCQELLSNDEIERIVGDKIGNFKQDATVNKSEVSSTLTCSYTKPQYRYNFQVNWYVPGQSTTAESDYVSNGVKISSLGAEANVNAIRMEVLSTNKKYLMVMDTGLPTTQAGWPPDPHSATYKINFEMAKTIDNNLNNY